MMPLILPATESYSSSSPSQICCTLLKLREHAGIIDALNFKFWDGINEVRLEKISTNKMIIDKI